jgi:hypothetical protein
MGGHAIALGRKKPEGQPNPCRQFFRSGVEAREVREGKARRKNRDKIG